MPQSDIFHPMIAEFYPQFVHDGWVYAPASSLAAIAPAVPFDVLEAAVTPP